ncbi:hypothetical protein GCM10010275_07780 [Streptomyces litmocidini]|uniref:DUF6932 family protein n=1 Tax=Streptomyces litmocidini TaxID=67318 RepID=UPI0019B86C4B|nr:hypothetical protein GCM10010275_07780 [Streptomyces litmocidini]
MPVPALVAATGTLPIGRYECTESEVRDAFVDKSEFASSVTRSNIWNDWETARETITSIVTVHSVWIAGSFTTSKIDPGDIDVVFLINGPEFDALDPQDRALVGLFATGSAGARQHGLQVDSYMIPWQCFPEPNPGRDPIQAQYYSIRGYWDDFWLRSRSGAKGSPPVREDAFPKRGYLEVKFRDYS